MQEELIPVIRLRTVETIEEPPITKLIDQINLFITFFLSTGSAQNIRKYEQHMRFLLSLDDTYQLVDSITNVLRNFIQNSLNKLFEGSSSNLCKDLLVLHNELMRKIQFLAEIFQQLEGFGRFNFFKNLFLTVEFQTIYPNQTVTNLITESFFQIVQNYRQQGTELTKQSLQFINLIKTAGLFDKIIEKYEIMTNTYYEEKRFELLKQAKWILLVEQELRRQWKLTNIIGKIPDTVSVVRKELIKETLPQLLGLVVKLMQEKDFDQLNLIWKYINMVQQATSLEKIIEQSIGRWQDPLSNIGVEGIILEKLKIMQICLKSFDNNKQLLSRIELSFENIFSRQSTLANEMMAEYIVNKLNSVNLSSQQWIVLFEMFRTNPSKDFLMEQYKYLLARYILVDKIDLTAHCEFVQKLADFFGNQMSKSLQTILNDVWKNGKPLVYQFGKLGCRILNKHEWPKIDAPELVLPDQLMSLREQFMQQYLKIKPNQQLRWIHWLSDITLSIDGLDIIVSEIQASIIYYIARAIRPMKKKQLANVLEIPITLVAQQLQDLKNINLVIQDKNQGLEIAYDDIKPYNYSKTYQPPVKTKSHIITDRALTIQANIVRIMKKKKILISSQIIPLVIDSIKRFKPTIEQINICLNSLHKKQFIEVENGVIKYKM